MNFRQAIAYGTNKLAHLENPQLESEVILGRTLAVDRTEIKMHPERRVRFWDLRRFKKFIKLRLKHIPVAYIFGQTQWNDLDLIVTKDTLIPRDETEILTQHIKASYASKLSSAKAVISNPKDTSHAPKTILDIGTGSGCIALWCKKQFPQADVLGVDLSESALKVARQNSQKHQVEIKFIKSDLCSNILHDQSYDLIIANLPYVPSTEAVSAEVQKEPDLALFSGEDGLDHIRKLAAQIKAYNLVFNHLWLEFLPTQSAEIADIFQGYKIKFFPDAGGQIFFARISSF